MARVWTFFLQGWGGGLRVVDRETEEEKEERLSAPNSDPGGKQREAKIESAGLRDFFFLKKKSTAANTHSHTHTHDFSIVLDSSCIPV